MGVRVYSSSRNKTWPSTKQYFDLPADGDYHDVQIECNQDEQVCFGAWHLKGSSAYWGLGLKDTSYCEDCCTTCMAGGQEAPVDVPALR